MSDLAPVNAVIIVDRSEGNAHVGTEWQETYVVPLDTTLRDALTHMFGLKLKMPTGRVTITIPTVMPQ